MPLISNSLRFDVEQFPRGRACASASEARKKLLRSRGIEEDRILARYPRWLAAGARTVALSAAATVKFKRGAVRNGKPARRDADAADTRVATRFAASNAFILGFVSNRNISLGLRIVLSVVRFDSNFPLVTGDHWWPGNVILAW